MPTLTVENYLKAIFQVSVREQLAWVTTGRLARAVSVSPGTVTTMIKGLSAGGLVEYVPYHGVRLTPAGRKLAVRMLRRHRLIELFLVETLKLTWDQVHDEAENMEHAVSDFLVDRIDEFLGFPEIDPHGDPIPAADGVMRRQVEHAVPLSECESGRAVRVIRVMNQQQEFLQFLAERGVGLGLIAVIRRRDREDVTLDVADRSGPLVLPLQAAEDVMVEELLDV